MKHKIVIMVVALFTTFLNAKSITIVLDNDASEAYMDQNYLVSKFLKIENLKRLGVTQVNLLTDRDKARVYLVSEDETPSLSNLDADDLGIIDGLEKVLTRTYTKDDLIIFLSTMDYVDRGSKTTTKGKVYNDAWIESKMSPIKRLMDKYPNTPLNKAKIIVIDTTKNLNYLNQRERFFSFLFAKVGGKLLYYGGLDFDKLRIEDYWISDKELHTLTQTPALRTETHLMLDDKVLQYELP